MGPNNRYHVLLRKKTTILNNWLEAKHVYMVRTFYLSLKHWVLFRTRDKTPGSSLQSSGGPKILVEHCSL